MAPLQRADVDGDNPSSDVGDSQDSPLRQHSEQPQSESSQFSQSPEPHFHDYECSLCGKLLDVAEDRELSKNDVLRAHLASDHSKILRFSDDDAADESGEHSDEISFHYDEDEPLNDDEVLNDAEKPDDGELGEEEEEEDEEATTAAADGDQSDAENDEAKSPDIRAKPSQEARGQLDRLEWLTNPRTSYPDEFRERETRWKEADLKDRLSRFWNVHDVKDFFPAYGQEEAKVERTWQHVFRDSKSKKRTAADLIARPGPYKTMKVEKGDFLDLDTLDDLLEPLQTPELLTPDELYALTEAASFAMRAWQDEYVALDKLYVQAHRHRREPLSEDAKRSVLMGNKKKTGHPLARVPEHVRDFEDKKEAMLYGYKHTYFQGNTSTTAPWAPQDPFAQGGYVPTPAQARRMAAKTGPDDRNPDGWQPVRRDRIEYVPRLWEPHKEPQFPKFTRKRKAAEVEAAAKTSETEEAQNEEAEAEEEYLHPAKRRTRGRGRRSAALEASQSVFSTTTSTRGSGRGRGRGRGRGGRPPTRASLEITRVKPQETSMSRRGRRGGSTVTTSTGHSTRSATETSTSLPTITPATTTGNAADPTKPATTTNVASKELSADALEEARRLKIVNSKNPKRTKAMLDHWDRFNREGRIRNPKRSKAQIEQDRAAEEARRATEPPRPSGRKKKSPSLAPIPSGNLAPKAPTNVAPITGAHHIPRPLPQNPIPAAIGMHHYGHPNPFNAPLPVAQLGQPMPPHYAPFPYLPWPPRDSHRG